MLDFFDLAINPSYDVKYYEGQNTGTNLDWQIWRKPRGAKLCYFFALGAGGGGGQGINTTTSSGGGGGGASGSQSTLVIPAYLIPDVLYIQAGQPGLGGVTSGSNGANGSGSYVQFEPDISQTPLTCLIYANGGGGGNAANSISGGVVSSNGVIATLANCIPAGKGFTTFYVGFGGGQGGSQTGNGLLLNTIWQTGLAATGGAGGGGTNGGSAKNGGSFSIPTSPLGAEFFLLNVQLGTGAVTSTPAKQPSDSNSPIGKRFLWLGGYGGGGGTSTAGGFQSGGGKGGIGCGGGGGGGAHSSVPTLTKAGDGGPGIVYIVTT